MRPLTALYIGCSPSQPPAGRRGGGGGGAEEGVGPGGAPRGGGGGATPRCPAVRCAVSPVRRGTGGNVSRRVGALWK